MLPQSYDTSLLLTDSDERIQKLAVGEVTPHADQPRRHFDAKALQELADSIKEHGILLPLVVRPLPKGGYQIVAGERRWRAAQLAGLKQVPAVVRTLKELEHLEIALVENVQRVDLSPLEQAISLQRLHEQFSVAYESIAKRLGKAPSTVNNMVRLLQLSPEAQEALTEQKISEGHARAILALKGQPDQQASLLQAIQDNGWSVRQAERYVTGLKQGVKAVPAARERVQTETPATKALGQRLNASVNIKRTAKGGKLEIGFKTDEDLQRIIDALG
ncbi:MAG: parB-like partition protein [Candidatus Saccharibacteria bacterium]|nr:parB-like partition protein [Candidatus Saccharibacteria bacterium]